MGTGFFLGFLKCKIVVMAAQISEYTKYKIVHFKLTCMKCELYVNKGIFFFKKELCCTRTTVSKYLITW